MKERLMRGNLFKGKLFPPREPLSHARSSPTVRIRIRSIQFFMGHIYGQMFYFVEEKDNTGNQSINLENVTRKPSSDGAIASTSTASLTVSRTLQNTGSNRARNLLCRTGVTEYDVKYVTEEKQLFAALLQVIQKWDPDILIGYEVQMFSWGFLLERALTFELDLCTHLSRVKGSSSSSNMDAEKDQYGAAHSSEIKIAGRIILNVWRLMRHEVRRNCYFVHLQV